jgi:hypothetical protein
VPGVVEDGVDPAGAAASAGEILDIGDFGDVGAKAPLLGDDSFVVWTASTSRDCLAFLLHKKQ